MGKKFLITGVSLRSKGGSAMVQAACNLIGKQHNYSVLSFYPELDKAAISSIRDTHRINVISYSTSLGRKIAFKLEALLMLLDYIFGYISGNKLLVKLSKYSKEISKTDGILEIHGIAFSDYYGFNDALTSFLKMKIAKFSKIPFFCLPQSYGPISSNLNRKLAEHGLESTELILPRGMKSLKLVEEFRLNNPHVEFMPDLAFAFNNPLEESTLNLLKKLKIYHNNKYAAVIPNILFLRWGFPETVSYYAEIIDHFHKKYGYKFILIPHQYNDAGTDDRTFNQEIYNKVSDKSCLIKIDVMLTAKEIKSLISVCDFTLCSRFHGMISSLKMGVEPFVISWAEKYHEIMDLYGLIENVQDHKQVDIKNFIDRIESRLQVESKEQIIAKNEEFMKTLKKLREYILTRC